MDKFESAIEYVLANEGGLSEKPQDPGGITKYGITLRTLKDWSPLANAQDVRNLSLENAKYLYKKIYWPAAPYEKIDSDDLRNYLFDAAINMGLASAVKCMQRALMSVQSQYHVLADDGVLGRKTLDAINDFHNLANGRLLVAFRSERAGWYRMIVKEHPYSIVFLHGWLLRAYGSNENIS